MRTVRVFKLMSWLLLVANVLIAATGTALHPASQVKPSAREAQGQTSSAAAYAQVKRVKLGDIVPMQADAADVYVQLIAIEGAVLLAVNE